MSEWTGAQCVPAVFLVSAGVLLVSPQLISVILVSVTSVISPVSVMSVFIPTVSVPRPVTRSLSLVTLLLPLSRSGPRPRPGPRPPLLPRSLPLSVSVSTLLRS